jgi:hypothetical protein
VSRLSPSQQQQPLKLPVAAQSATSLPDLSEPPPPLDLRSVACLALLASESHFSGEIPHGLLDTEVHRRHAVTKAAAAAATSSDHSAVVKAAAPATTAMMLRPLAPEWVSGGCACDVASLLRSQLQQFQALSPTQQVALLPSLASSSSSSSAASATSSPLLDGGGAGSSAGGFPSDPSAALASQNATEAAAALRMFAQELQLVVDEAGCDEATARALALPAPARPSSAASSASSVPAAEPLDDDGDSPSLAQPAKARPHAGGKGGKRPRHS